MGTYLIKRLLLLIPTLFVILMVNFTIVQFAPGGPVEQAIAKLKNIGGKTALSNVLDISSDLGGSQTNAADPSSVYQGRQGVPQEIIEDLERRYGFDKPFGQRFIIMVKNYLVFDFGESYQYGRPVTELIIERLPVSISLGFWAFLISYLISIPLGIKKALASGTPFDRATSFIVSIGYAIPGFLLAIFLIILFAGGSYFQIFPLRGLVSANFDTLSLSGKILDYFWHMTLPVIALTISSFAFLTQFTKNSFLDQIHQQYVYTAKAKGLSDHKVLYGHVFRNAMLIIISGFPSAFISMLFTGSLLIETIFTLDGLGLLGYQSIIYRDYPVVFATLYFFSLIGLLAAILRDISYVLIDPRIDFNAS